MKARLTLQQVCRAAFFIILALIGQIASGQTTNKKTDSLLALLRTAKPDTSKVMLLGKIATTVAGDTNKVGYANQELALAAKLNWPAGRIRAYSMLGLLAVRRREYEASARYYQQAYNIARPLNNLTLLHPVLSPLGLALRLSGKYDEAIKYFTMDYEYGKDGPPVKSSGYIEYDWSWPAWQLGITYDEQKNDKKAYDFFKQILQDAEKQKKLFEIIAAHQLLADYYLELRRDYGTAIAEYKTILQLYKNDGSKTYASIYQDLAEAYLYVSEYQKALACYRRFTNLFYQSNVQEAQRVMNNFTSDVYAAMNNYKKKLAFDLQDYKAVVKQETYRGELANVCNDLSIDYDNLKQYDSAKYYSQKAVQIDAKANDKWNESYTLIQLTQVYFDLKDYTNALKTAHEGMSYKLQQQSDFNNYDYLLGLIYRDAPADVLKQDNINPGNRYTEAHKKLQQALAYAIVHNDLALQRDCYKALSQVDEQRGDYKGAYSSYKPYVALKDSLNNQHDQDAINRQEEQIKFTREEDSLKYHQQLVNQKAQQQTYYYIGGIAFLLIISFFVTRNALNQRKSNKIITAEKQRSENLLLNILPADVAEELKQSGGSEARLFNEVTVLFTDFVNFTTVSELLTPQELVAELHACFKAFDEIISRHKVEKIKTIGDAYLAVTGLPSADAEHARNIVKAALEIQQFIRLRKQQLGNKTFNIRIGIHSGSVVAGIVGVKKFAYDIWGDTVNVAARMEQNSEPGKINLSEDTYQLVKQQFAFTFRGEIQAKNKGAMKMYFVEGALQ